MPRRKATDIRYENLNWAYLKKAIKAEGYTESEVSIALGMSARSLSNMIKRGYIYEDVLEQLKEVVTIDEGKLIAVPRPKEMTEEKTQTIDEAIEELKKAPQAPKGDIMAKLEELSEKVGRIEQALERAGYMQVGYEAKATGVLERMLDHGAVSKEDYIKELVRLGIPHSYTDKAIEKAGCTVAQSRDGKSVHTWLIRG